jgi:phosphoribosylanthranilate isomerase
MSLKVKVCGLREEGNFKEVAALGVDYLGMIFVPSSPRYISKADALQLSKLERGRAKLTGVFKNQEQPEVEEYILELNLDCVQLHGNENYAAALKVRFPKIEILKAVNSETLNKFSSDGVDYLLLDNKEGGSGVKFDWSIVGTYNGVTPLIIAGGIAPGDSERVLELSKTYPQVKGVDLNSRFEISPGVKDVNKIREFYELLCR